MEKSKKKGAAALNISPCTVETHFGHILQKLNLHYPTEFVLYVVREGSI
jgi:DNA-binding NarL/FixJ family response regulator